MGLEDRIANEIWDYVKEYYKIDVDIDDIRSIVVTQMEE